MVMMPGESLAYVSVFTLYVGNPDGVSNAGKSAVPRRSALTTKMASPERA